MWKQLYASIRSLISLARDVQCNTADIKALREDFHEMHKLLDHLLVRMEYQEKQMAVEQESFRRELEAEREKFKLQLENLMLRYLQKLPPPEKPEE
jgi:hypothetical protein